MNHGLVGPILLLLKISIVLSVLALGLHARFTDAMSLFAGLATCLERSSRWTY
jgi:hypothetical protein